MKQIIFLLFIIPSYGFSQTLPTDTSYNKWIRSVVNIETRMSNSNLTMSYWKEMQNGQHTWEEYNRFLDSLMYNPQTLYGTAIFLQYNKKHYLITARHLLFDPSGGRENSVVAKILLIENDSLLNFSTQFMYRKDSPNITDLPIPFIMLPQDKMEAFLSSDEEDIGLIDLDFNISTKDFLHTLLNRGYIPIKMKDIDTVSMPKKGDFIYAIGFPRNAYFPFRRQGNESIWQSRLISTRIISKGVYLEEYPRGSNFFDAGIFVYSGFSGGPIISRGKLIGVVSSGEIVDPYRTGEDLPFKNFGINRSKFIKSSLILPLIRRFESERIRR